MNERIRQKARELGFAQAFFLTPSPAEMWRDAVQGEGQLPEAQRLNWNPLEATPFAKCLVLLVYAYSPFASGERIPAYYLASQRGYLAARELVAWLGEQGAMAELSSLPVRALALQHGLGQYGLNGLLSLPGWGSRVVLYAIATDAVLPELVPTGVLQQRHPACRQCGLCAKACPAQAIHPARGLNPSACMRAHMERAPFPSWVEKIMPGFLGCEICQSVCPLNSALPFAQPTSEQRQAFCLTRLAQGDAAAARKLVGKNITRQEKLPYQARIFLQRQPE